MLACPSCGEANPERARFCLSCGTALSAEGAGERARETRRQVSVLFTDVAGSTTIGEQLDPEALREVMQRYFDAMRVAIERHEGTVEKFIGDAVMAVFGIPQIHEDDALRAVRAAFDMQSALETLNRDIGERWGVQLAIRTGVNTGEVVAGDAATGQSLATGDVVNTAARLEQAAGAGEVLIGPLTYRLVRHAVTAEQASPLELKGKAERVAPWRVRAVNLAVGAQARHMDSPMVGRDRQLRLLTDAAERARDDRAPQLVTVLGLAGVGKSRLVHEFLGRIREAATVIRGRCLSYGDAISYWPLAEAFRGAAGIEPGDPPEKAIERLTALAGGVAQSQVVAERVAAAIGLASADAVATGGQETFWAVRRLLEAMARRQPLVAVFDDMQWGTPTFLDLIEHITDWSRDAPILLLAIARPELLEARPTWGGGKMNAATLFLEPLDEASVSEMLLHLTGSALPEELARRIAQAAEGNPLFVEELLSMLVDDRILEREGDAYRVTRMPEEIAVPPTIELLLAARLDHLPSEERAVLGRAAVVGKSFGASEVAELSPDPERTSVLPRLMALVRKELVRLDEAPARDDEILGEKVRFRFRHQLVRDAAYESLPKQERARLHEAYAGWLETALEPRTSELHEVIGHHLEQAHRYRRAVGGDEAATQVLARRAAGHLASAARRATAIGDRTAVIRLLEGLGALLPDDDVDRLATRPQLAAALVETGRLGEAQRAIDEVLDAPSAPPATRAEALEQVGVAEQQGRSAVEMRPAVEEALRIRRELGDPRGIASALDAASRIEFFVGRLTRVQALAEEGIRYAREAGDADLEARLRQTQLVALLMSPEGGGKALPMLREACEFARANGLRAMEGLLQAATGFQTAVSGSRAEGEELMRQGLAIILDLGMRVGAPTNLPAQVAYFAGDIRAAIEELRTTYDELTAVGEKGYLSTHAAELAHWHLDLDEVDAADEYCRVAAESGAHDDVVTQVEVIAARARILARRGSLGDAEALAREALALADTVEYSNLASITRLSLGDVLRLQGRGADAAALWRQVIALEEHRGNQLYVGRLRRELDALEAIEG